MRAARKAVEEVTHIFVDQTAFVEQTRKFTVLGVVRQFAVDQQIGYVNENTVFDQLLDGITAVAQDSLLTVDVSDIAVTACGVDKSGIERDQTGRLAQS